MRTRLKNLWGKLVASYWFVPALMCAMAAVGATSALHYDLGPNVLSNHAWLQWASVNTTDGARALLSTIAGSMITVAGVIFSINVLALSFASSQYGPRLLRNFMRDRPSQVVLGAFLATYLYCVLVLRTVGSSAEKVQLPHLAIAGALVLGLASLAVLIFFIHHVARAIQVSSVVEGVGRDLTTLIAEFVQRPSQRPTASEAAGAGGHRCVIESLADGYVQALAFDELVATAATADGVVQMHVTPGDYVSSGLPLATLHTRTRPEPLPLKPIRTAIVVGTQRTNDQDLEFPIDQLAEIAVRALSPGVNDPFTAILCINRLGAALGSLAGVRWPAPSFADQHGHERLRLLPNSLERLLHRSFDQILHYGATNRAIARQVMKMLAHVAGRACADHAPAVGAFADHVMQQLAPAAGDEAQRNALDRWHASIEETLNRGRADAEDPTFEAR